MGVGHHGQFVGSEVVSPPNDKVAEVNSGRSLQPAAEPVFKLNLAAGGGGAGFAGAGVVETPGMLASSRGAVAASSTSRREWGLG